MSKETRTIRPFVGLGDLPDALDETLLHFGQEPCPANQGITVDLAPHEFLLRPVSIEWASDDEALSRFKARISEGARAVGFAVADLSLVAVASSSFLKLADVVFELSAEAIEGLQRRTELTDGERPAALSAPFSGFSLDVYLLLSRSLDPKPLRPHLRGTWIGWSRFRVGTTQGPALLPPTPLTNEIRERHRLPAKTIRFLYFGDHDLLEPYGDQEQPVFYIDEDLLAQMNARRRSPASKALQLQLAHDFVSAVVRRASVNSELTNLGYEDVRGSLLGSVVRIAAGPGATDGDRDRLVADIRGDPEYVIARAEHFIDVASGFGGMLEEGET